MSLSSASFPLPRMPCHDSKTPGISQEFRRKSDARSGRWTRRRDGIPRTAPSRTPPSRVTGGRHSTAELLKSDALLGYHRTCTVPSTGYEVKREIPGKSKTIDDRPGYWAADVKGRTMSKWFLRILHLSLACSALWAPAIAGQESYPVDVRTQVDVPMRDGVRLSTNIFLPKTAGKWPVILMRSPYGKGDEKQGDGLYYAARGYVFVSQDCRGRGASQGQWEPFVNEAPDGWDTQKWILAQPWCNGAIGTMGGSYVGFTQWAPAPDADGYLKAMVPVVPLVDPYGDIAYIDGAFGLSLMMGWGSLMSSPPAGMKMPSWDGAGWLKAYRTLPLADWDRVLGYRVQYLRDWVAHPHYDSYWAARGVRDRRQDIRTPIFAIGGWYDIFAKTTHGPRERRPCHVTVVRRPQPPACADGAVDTWHQRHRQSRRPGLRQGFRSQPARDADPVV
jgi:hypothetical protein